ncbi:hypothetical protein DRE_00901 [Drechslerella stenobrocha 248]|uniref:Uncharacterized protein n=1 Tax=Drechslerella stenobrocha 248 TaxID=1043628 RepID=W7HXJ6_9PEZI|nr:hypothetical protein DRE_00901 [Drechslerella stenobrocha 248]
MKAFYESHGSESIFYRVNEAANAGWVEVLGQKGPTRADDAPLLQRLPFCGPCCNRRDEPDGDGFEGSEESEEEEEGQVSVPAPGVNIDSELQTLQRAARLLTRNSVSSQASHQAADKALARLENDPALPPGITSDLLGELVGPLTNAAWYMASGAVASSVEQELGSDLLEPLEQMAMLKLRPEQAPEIKDDLSKCVKYTAALLPGDRLKRRLHEASEQLLGVAGRHFTLLASKTLGSRYTPLHLAVMANNTAAAGALLEAERVPLSYAPIAEMVEILLGHGTSLNARDRGGSTMLHWAVHEKTIYAAPALLDAGLKLSERDYAGGNALHIAVAAQDHELVALLLDKDISVIGEPAHGEATTALHISTGNGDGKMVRLLLDNGAEACFDQSPPLNITVASGRLDLVKLFHWSEPCKAKQLWRRRLVGSVQR